MTYFLKFFGDLDNLWIVMHKLSKSYTHTYA